MCVRESVCVFVYIYRESVCERESVCMCEQEEDYRFVIMKGDLRNESWTSICVSQADSVRARARSLSLPASLPLSLSSSSDDVVGAWDDVPMCVKEKCARGIILILAISYSNTDS